MFKFGYEVKSNTHLGLQLALEKLTVYTYLRRTDEPHCTV